MSRLSDIFDIAPKEEKQAALKKVFMPYTANIDVDGVEKEALTILLNLSFIKPKCKNWLDEERASSYFQDDENVTKFLAEVKWFHTHNLKYPDCRVKNQRIIAKPLPSSEPGISSRSLEPLLGWAHNSAAYGHTVWLLNQFNWQSKSVNLFSLLQHGSVFWQALLKDFGLSSKDLARLESVIGKAIPKLAFPDTVSSYSKQLRFPWLDDYLSITPVVNHALQQALEHKSREKSCQLKFVNLTFPNSASIGNLCGSLGGNMKALNYPVGVKPKLEQTLSSSRKRSRCYFDDYQLTNAKTCQVLDHLAGVSPLKTDKQRQKARQDQTKIIRKQIARWMLPLIELRDLADTEHEVFQIEYDDLLVESFLSTPEVDFPSLAASLNQRLHFTLQNNRYTRKFAYHPKLIQVLKAQIEWVLNRLSRPQEEVDNIGDEQYLYLSSLRIQDAKAMSSPYLCGVPSLTAIWGFVHRYQRDFNQLLDEADRFEFSSFAFYVRDENIRKTAKLTEFCSLVHKTKVSKAKRSTIRSEMLSDLEIDLVIRVRGGGRLSDYHSKLQAALPVSFAGGSVFQPLLSSSKNWLRTFSNRIDLFQGVKGIPCYGEWLIPVNQQPITLDELESVLKEDETLMPISNGYHLLEVPHLRKDSVTGLHAYAENILGVAKRVNPIEIRFSGRDHFFGHAFWSLECTSETILIKNG